MRIYDIILKKRNGFALTKDEINYFVHEYTKGNIPDYQAASLLMAIYFQTMNKEETANLTEAMMNSGDVLDLSRIHGIKVDKHSTGGVGDTTTLIVAPLVASCNVPVAKMSGRGLGHTGGTIDKLESIKGFHVELTNEQFIENVNQHKIAVIGQSANLAPADKKLYALRDVTATVDNLSLIASSIMSKKLAAGSNAIILDVKVGSGAFMKDLDSGIALAQEMVDIGHHMGRETVAILTSMEQPLGYAIGNSLEIEEAIQTLHGNGPEDLTELSTTIASYMVLLAKEAVDIDAARERVMKQLQSGEALNKFREFIEAQGGDPSVTIDASLLPKAAYTMEVLAPEDGFIQSIKTDDIGVAALVLGAGRENKDSQIDLAAGIIMKRKVGDHILKGEPYATLYTNKKDMMKKAQDIILNAISLTNVPVEKPKLIKAIVMKDHVTIM
ncbi:pyrimidine-nucleoside phosphorylase [Anaerosolibacter carboniphilus]|uniref:Pyrimidine-nucleoside phosphorylase n=1 Tax=Anaerosolibacter carboniphilus TaxID=1417629 RepID=A0A841KSU4_9FIRM|nr:pyrimidine-nucleoside phosphorylase [Anaerosolibacter carboniphilus]MBB6216656.1 pyrimidine-nucleoside phosphorylase [Anaerosolibacter carboniphilus]